MAKSGRVPEKLTVPQGRFVMALIHCRTIRDAARKAKVPERTAYRYLKDAAVLSALTEAQAQVLKDVTRQTVNAMTEAVEALRSIVANVKSSTTARVSAARTILDSGLRLTEVVGLMERVEAIERKLKETSSELKA
ncbi:unnamed protein product [marine sediment metagenome]|uniref:Uncharacterized protein n=1 Tax=marine sediment metagenome TaxID=412755 RepID=X1LBV8_9ZZZZ